MPEKYLYEFAVIRYVPRVERSEFLNVGVILFCKKENLILLKYKVDEQRISAFSPDSNLKLLEDNLCSFHKIAEGASDGGPIARLDAPSRFRWLTALKSSMIQTSRPHPGFSLDLEASAQKLFTEMVG